MKIRVLIVDDHPLVRDGLKVMLSLAPDLVLAGEACNGREALEVLRDTEVDVVLMDINMPEMNGIEATRIISRSHSGMKVLALTMHDSPEYKKQMSASGALGYILKCATMDSLFDAIRSAFNGGLRLAS